MPSYPFERMAFECPDDKKFKVIENLKEKLRKEFDNVNTIDGVRVDFSSGWVLMRVSNTAPLIRLTTEGDTKEDFEKLQNKFIALLEDEIKKFGIAIERKRYN